MRLLFAGTPDVAVPSLDALVSSQHEVIAVLTRPPAPAGRGRGERPSAVHARALELGLPVVAAMGLAEPRTAAFLRDLAPDCCPVVAYGALVTPQALAIPAAGWINLHFSLLPRWRGAAPVQHAIRAGDAQTGATTFRIDEGLDTGPVLDRLRTPIGDRETAGELLGRLAVDGASLLVDTIDAIASGDAVATPQSEDGATLAPRIDVADARIDWTSSSIDVDRLVRAMTPAPGAWTTFRGMRLRLGPVLPVPAEDGLPAGRIRVGKREVLVGTGTHPVRLGEVVPEGRRSMAAVDWARGVRPGDGEGVA